MKKLLCAWSLLLIFAGVSFAAAPVWMPNFPMRMGAAGVMGMWMPMPGASEYKVMRKIDNGSYEQVYKGPMNNFQDPAAPADKDVTYKVVAVVGGADSDSSSEAKLAGQKPLVPPTEIIHRISPEDKQVILRWKLSEGASFYNVYKGATKDSMKMVSSVQEPKFVDTDIEDGKSYNYALTAVGGTGQESVKGETYTVKVEFPKVKVVKKFNVVLRNFTLVNQTQGEDFAEFKNPGDMFYGKGFLYITDDTGIQKIDEEGNFVARLPLLTEKIANREWTQPLSVYVGPDERIYLTHVNDDHVTILNSTGDQLVRRIKVPGYPGSDAASVAISATLGPDNNIYVLDKGHMHVVVLNPNIEKPTEAEVVKRIGYPFGEPIEKKPADVYRLTSASRIKWLEGMRLFAVMEPQTAHIVFFDEKGNWVKGKTPEELGGPIGGMGGSLNNFSSLSDFAEYDGTSLILLEVLGKTIRQIRVSDGDYLATLTDSDDPAKVVFQAPGSVTRIGWNPTTNRLFVLSGFDGVLYIYDMK